MKEDSVLYEKICEDCTCERDRINSPTILNTIKVSPNTIKLNGVEHKSDMDTYTYFKKIKKEGKVKKLFGIHTEIVIYDYK